jgi:flagellar motor switch protein FliM
MATDALLKVSTRGAVTRRGADILDADAAAISVAIKRALPFLTRKGVAIMPKATFAGTAAELEELTMLPGVDLTFGDAVTGHVALDRNAAERLIDGVLGGDGQPPAERRPVLSPAQKALAARLTQTVARCMAERLQARFSLRVTVAPTTSAVPTDGVYFFCFFEIGEGVDVGTIVLAVPRSVAAVPEPTKRERFMKPEPGVVHAVSEVEVSVAVKLGSVAVSLARLARLAPGEVLMTDVPIAGAVTVQVDDRPLFTGHPTAVAGRMAVKLEHKLDG